jgi:fido (protein-threonine AMPylation protein)
MSEANTKNKHSMNTTEYATEYTTTTGKVIDVSFPSLEEACKRLALLNIQEMNTKSYAPTDSGSVRANHQAEASAILALLVALHRRLITPTQTDLYV